MMDLSWQDKAACKNLDSEVFFPERKGQHAEAEIICESCPVRMECLVFAIEHNIEHGVWGGYTVRARRKIKKRGRFVA